MLLDKFNRGHKASDAVKKLLDLEEKSGLLKLETYEKFANRVKVARENFMQFLLDMKKQNKVVVGRSAPGRCVTLLNYYGADSELIPYLGEQSASLKIGKFLPGKHLPIVDTKKIYDEQPNYVIIMAWHYADPIMAEMKRKGYKNDFVIPLPDFRIVRNSQVKI
jgi:hypothetical protein